MQTKSKKFLSTLLAVMVVFGLFAAMPLTVLADDITQPQNASIRERGTASFSVSLPAFAGTSYYYQWYLGDPSGMSAKLSNGGVYSGVTTNTLTLTNVPYSYNDNQYYCVVTVRVGLTAKTLTSNTATLRVLVGFPTNVKATADSTGVTVTWADNSDVEYGFTVARYDNVINGGNYKSFHVPANTTTYKDTTAEAGKTYVYYVDTRITESSNTGYLPGEVVTVTMPAALAAPSNLTATAGATGITLNWVNNAPDGNYIGIFRKEGSGSWFEYMALPGTPATWMDTNVEAGKTYTYRMRVYTSDTYSVYSNEATATMGAAGAVTITGPTTMALAVGYTATSTDVYTITGTPAPTVTKTSGNASITWNNSTKKLDIAAGLAAGTYPVVLTATSGTNTATLTFTLTVTAGVTITGPTTMTLTAGYTATSTEVYTITGTPAPTVAKTSGNAAITWNDATKKLDIAAGLAAGTYPVVLKATNSAGEAEFTFTLTVAAAEPPPAEKPFPFIDVHTTDWFYNDVKTAWEQGLINGKTATLYAPYDNLTYAEAVKLAACMHQLYTTGSVSLTNGSPNWYDSYVTYAKNNGIISKDYSWNSPATRAGYMEIFANALPAAALAAINIVADGAIPDVPTTHSQAAAIYKLYRAGIVQGVDAAHNCNPGSNIRRNEVAAILTRMMNESARISFSM